MASDEALAQLLCAEHAHVKRAVKRALEPTEPLELPYAAARQQAVELYAMERAVRAASGDTAAAALNVFGRSDDGYPCAVSATLFTANHDIQSLLVSRDPLVKAADEELRRAIEGLARESRDACTFDGVLAAYLKFAAAHRRRLLATRSPSAAADAYAASGGYGGGAYSGGGNAVGREGGGGVVGHDAPVFMPLEVASFSALPLPPRSLLPPFMATVGNRTIEFPTAATWAAFIANRRLWKSLPGSPLRTAPSAAGVASTPVQIMAATPSAMAVPATAGPATAGPATTVSTNVVTVPPLRSVPFFAPRRGGRPVYSDAAWATVRTRGAAPVAPAAPAAPVVVPAASALLPLPASPSVRPTVVPDVPPPPDGGPIGGPDGGPESESESFTPLESMAAARSWRGGGGSSSSSRPAALGTAAPLFLLASDVDEWERRHPS